MPRTPFLAALLIVIIGIASVAGFPFHHYVDSAMKRAALGIAFESNNSPNFTVAIYPQSQTVRIGEQATYRITLNSTNSFAGQVALRTENFPPELLKSFTPANVTVTANKLANSTLTVNTFSVGEESFYTFTILATSGNLTQRVTASLTVLAESGPLSIASYIFLAGVLLFAAFVIWYGLGYRQSHLEEREEINDEPKPPPV